METSRRVEIHFQDENAPEMKMMMVKTDGKPGSEENFQEDGNPKQGWKWIEDDNNNSKIFRWMETCLVDNDEKAAGVALMKTSKRMDICD